MPLSSAALRTILSNRLFWVGAGLFTVLSTLALGFYFSSQPGYSILFRELKPMEAASITEDLDKHKEPYELSEGGTVIKVPPERVDALRVRFQAGDVPLKGTVGLELFSGSDLGMTDFAQKVNYQRALQGELVRTISSLEGVESARVHLSIPDSTLFRRTEPVPRASVVVFMRHGITLTPATVRGVQQIVAASVPELQADEVVVTDAAGTPASHDQWNGLAKMDPRLAQKLAIEDYYIAKLTGQLNGMLGDGHAIVVVDVALGRDEKHLTTEQTRSSAPSLTSVNVPPLPEGHDAGGTRPNRIGAQPSDGSGPDSNEQVVSKRVEEISSLPGAIDRLSVSVILRDLPGDIDVRLVRQAVESAAGILPARGDVVSVAVEPVSDVRPVVSAPQGETPKGEQHRIAVANPVLLSVGSVPTVQRRWLMVAAFAIVTGLAALGVVIVRRRRQAAARRRDYAQQLKQILAGDVQSA